MPTTKTATTTPNNKFFFIKTSLIMGDPKFMARLYRREHTLLPFDGFRRIKRLITPIFGTPIFVLIKFASTS
jgi:hypothetical protein